jgi:hypothetical protein
MSHFAIAQAAIVLHKLDDIEVSEAYRVFPELELKSPYTKHRKHATMSTAKKSAVCVDSPWAE